MSANIYGQLGGMALGLAGNLAQNSQQKQDKRIAGGKEAPELAEMRRRLAAQNAQTAMSVAASQQGVNPALAQRNAQQALAQQQVRTNAALAAQGTQVAAQSRQANRGVQQQRVQGTLAGLAQGANMLGTLAATEDAAAVGPAAAPDTGEVVGSAAGLAAPPVAGNMPQEGAAGLGSSLAVQGAAGLSAPIPSSAPQGAVPVAQATPDQMLQAMSPQGLNSYSTEPAGQLQMRGAGPQLSGPLGEVSPNRTTIPNTAIPTAPVQETAVETAAPSAVPQQVDAPPQEVSPVDAYAMLPVEVQNEPMNAVVYDNAQRLRAAGMTEQADAIILDLLGRL